MKYLFLIISILSVCLGTTAAIDATEITYIASEAVYINSGTNDGLNLGDTLRVYRNDSLQAVIIVSNISSTSSACTIAELFGIIQAGDILDFQPISQPAKIQPVKKSDPQVKKNKSEYNSVNIDGYIAVQNYYQQYMTGSSLSYTQPSLISKIKIENITNGDWTLSLRHRTRYTNRNRALGSSLDKDDWSHRVYELSLSNNRNSSWRWWLGRRSSTEVRGIGLIDGLSIKKQLSKQISLGFAGGFEPNRTTTDVAFDRPKAGLYISMENKPGSVHKIRFSTGLAGSYFKSNISREFIALNSSYYFKHKFSAYASSEIDINRGWRKEMDNKSVSLTNVYLNLRYSPTEKTTFYTSYDRRDNYLVYENKDAADSLFDDDLYQSLRVGSNIKLSKQIRFTGYGGIRFRESSFENNIFASGSLSINRFPKPSHAASIRFSYVQTDFTTGYRPSISYRFPLAKYLRMNLTGTAYHYTGLSFSNTQYYLDLQGNFYSISDYFFSASYRQYFDSNNQSGQLFLEIGWNL